MEDSSGSSLSAVVEQCLVSLDVDLLASDCRSSDHHVLDNFVEQSDKNRVESNPDLTALDHQSELVSDPPFVSGEVLSNVIPPDFGDIDLVHARSVNPSGGVSDLPGLVQDLPVVEDGVREEEPHEAGLVDGREGEDGMEVLGKTSEWHDYRALMGNTLPSKSKPVYMRAYADLETYLRKENQLMVGIIPSEHAMLNYFFYLKNVKKFAPSTIWYYVLTLLFHCNFWVFLFVVFGFFSWWD